MLRTFILLLAFGIPSIAAQPSSSEDVFWLASAKHYFAKVSIAQKDGTFQEHIEHIFRIEEGEKVHPEIQAVAVSSAGVDAARWQKSAQTLSYLEEGEKVSIIVSAPRSIFDEASKSRRKCLDLQPEQLKVERSKKEANQAAQTTPGSCAPLRV